MKEKPQKHELEVRVYITNVTLHVWQSKEKPTSTQSQCLKEKKKKQHKMGNDNTKYCFLK